eukprot:1707642-Amphidinium_carterae.1
MDTWMMLFECNLSISCVLQRGSTASLCARNLNLMPSHRFGVQPVTVWLHNAFRLSGHTAAS